MKIIALTVFAVFILGAFSVFAGTEAVILQKVMDTDSKAIIQRKNGEQHLIEYGIGVLSIWRYEGKVVIIDSPGLFLGVGSSIILSDADQKARIWDSKLISNGSAALPSNPSNAVIDDELTLFDSSGQPVAYVDMKDEMTIYLWNGYPVAFLVSSNNCFSIYGFNGKHLGWFEKGIIRDHRGMGVGFSKGAVSNIQLKSEPLKKLKKLKSLKSLQQLEPLRPADAAKFSEIPLKIFLGLGSGKELNEVLD
jgi:hypothetical protein